MNKNTMVLLGLFMVTVILLGYTLPLAITPSEKTMTVKFYDQDEYVKVPFGFVRWTRCDMSSASSTGSWTNPLGHPPDWDRPTQITYLRAEFFTPITKPFWGDLYVIKGYKSVGNSTNFVITSQTITHSSGSYTTGGGSRIYYDTKEETIMGYFLVPRQVFITATDEIGSGKGSVEDGVTVISYSGVRMAYTRSATEDLSKAVTKSGYYVSLTITRYYGVSSPGSMSPTPAPTEPEPSYTTPSNGPSTEVVTEERQIDVKNDYTGTSYITEVGEMNLALGAVFGIGALVVFVYIFRRRNRTS